MISENCDLVLLQPKNRNLQFSQKQLRNGDLIWMTLIIIRNESEHYLAFKLMTTVPKMLNCYPPAGILAPKIVVQIKLASKEILDAPCYVKIQTISIDKPMGMKDEFEVLDMFKYAKHQEKEIQSLKLNVIDFVSNSENISQISFPSERRIQGEDAQLTSMKMSMSLKRIASSKMSNFHGRQALEQYVVQLQREQEELIEETRELNRRIVLFKAEKGLDLEEPQPNQLVFSFFQLFVIALISVVLGYYISD